MISVPDDIDSRPGSTTSLLRTVVGLYLRELGGWMPARSLVEIMSAVGVEPPLTRTALVRVRGKGLLAPEAVGDVSGYRVAPEATRMLERGERRIFRPRRMAVGDAWCLVSFSLAEDDRVTRHRLRRRLSWLGCGMVAPGLWICPDLLAAEVEEALVDLEVREAATLFSAHRPRVAGDLRDAVARWWDLEALDALHREVSVALEELLDEWEGSRTGADREACGVFVRGIDIWRSIPSLDPGLPLELLPEGWPGDRSVELFERLVSRSRPASRSFVDGCVRSALS